MVMQEKKKIKSLLFNEALSPDKYNYSKSDLVKAEAYIALSEAIFPGPDYLLILKNVHNWLKPESYVEIGVNTGKSLALCQSSTVAIGIDPHPNVSNKFIAPTKIITMTSDAFFDSQDILEMLQVSSIKMAFIDGLHLFEQTLKDFINLERCSRKDSLIFIHDCFPLDEISSTRTRTTEFWSGDVWKVIICLKAYRPDLKIITIPTKPSGLGVVTNLDPTSTVLKNNLDKLFNEFAPLSYSYLAEKRNVLLNVVQNDWSLIVNNMI